MCYCSLEGYCFLPYVQYAVTPWWMKTNKAGMIGPIRPFLLTPSLPSNLGCKGSQLARLLHFIVSDHFYGNHHRPCIKPPASQRRSYYCSHFPGMETDTQRRSDLPKVPRNRTNITWLQVLCFISWTLFPPIPSNLWHCDKWRLPHGSICS